MKRWVGVPIALTVMAAVVGCGGTDAAAPSTVTSTVQATVTASVTAVVTTTAPPSTAPAVTVTKTIDRTVTPASTAEPTSSVAAPTAPSGMVSIGKTLAGSGTDARVTVEKFTSTVDAEPAPGGGNRWAAALIRNCVGTGLVDGSYITNNLWLLIDDDDGQYAPSNITYGSFPTPEYPIQTDIKDGDCVKGWIVFDVPAKANIVEVRYARPGSDTEEAVRLSWSTK